MKQNKNQCKYRKKLINLDYISSCYLGLEQLEITFNPTRLSFFISRGRILLGFTRGYEVRNLFLVSVEFSD